MIRFFAIIFFLFASKLSCQDKISKLYSLGKIYGYVRYFYPSIEADSINWDKFLIYALKEIENTPSEKLNSKLLALFAPIAPAIKFSNRPFPDNFFPNDVFPSDSNVFQSKYLRNKQKKKYSKKTIDNSIPENKIKITECVNEKISNNIYLYMPLVLYSNNFGSFPKPNKEEYLELLKKLNSINSNDSSIYNRLAGVIIIWSKIQHYYPYRDFLPPDWDEVLMKSLSACYETKSTEDYLKLLNRLLAQINDGHAFAYFKNGPPSYFPSFKWDYINDSLIISYVHDTLENKLEIGDIVLAVDGIKTNNLIEQKRKETSSATKSFSDFIAARRILCSNKKRWFNLQIQKPNGEAKKVDIYRGLKYVDYSMAFINPHPQFILINDSTYYINFHKASQQYIDSLIPVILNKNIICDLRGYPNSNHGFLCHLLTLDDTVKHHFKILEVLFPDFRHVNYKSGGWQLKKRKPHLTGKMVFLIDNSIVSYGESFMSLVQHYHLGTIIGTHTAGTNGNMASVDLPVAGISFSYTGLLVTKPNGSPLHGVGILPDIEVKPTIKGIRNGKDEILEKAISFLNTSIPK